MSLFDNLTVSLLFTRMIFQREESWLVDWNGNCCCRSVLWNLCSITFQVNAVIFLPDSIKQLKFVVLAKFST